VTPIDAVAVPDVQQDPVTIERSPLVTLAAKACVVESPLKDFVAFLPDTSANPAEGAAPLRLWITRSCAAEAAHRARIKMMVFRQRIAISRNTKKARG
jgi:hypothetical protein